MTNFSPASLDLTAVHAFDPRDGSELAHYHGDSLLAVVRRVGTRESGRTDLGVTVEAGNRVIVFMWITVPIGQEPTALRHRIAMARVTDEGDTVRLTVETEPQTLGRAPVVIAPPMRGDAFFAANGPDNATGHRRALIPVAGRARIAQRFATDWVQVIGGATNDGDREDNATYHIWGAEALAVADGVVADVKDGIPENVPGLQSRAVEITLETVGGNYVIIDIGGGNFAFYAHLQPGSIRVAPGDRVRVGDVVGLVGNSGNSTEPHLHFHVADAASPLGAEGVPFVFDRFEITGRSAGFGEPVVELTPAMRHREIPMANVFVRFPE